MTETETAPAPGVADPVTETAILAADMIVLHRDPDTRLTSVLLLRRHGIGDWALPGGKVDRGETFLTAGVRELEEETGVVVNPADCRPSGLYDAVDRDPRGRVVSRAFLVRLHVDARPVPLPGPGEASRVVEWVPVREALRRRFWADHHDILCDALYLAGGW